MLDATNPFFTDVAAGMEIAAERADLTLYLCNSDSRKNREVMYLDALQQQRVQGILITPVEPDSPQLEAVVGRGTPLVVVDRHSRDTDFCTVAVDDRLGGRLAIEHLVDQGHTSVAFVAGPMSIGQVRDRYEGAKDAWRDAGLPDSALICITGSALTASEGRSAGERLSGLPRKRRPTAAFCANDLLALGLLQNFITAGRRVPEDIAIVGYDDIDFAASAAVPLTSIRQPRQELGTKAAELVIDEADNPEHTHEHVVFIPEIVARASTLGLRSSLRA
jgi:LacI family transcriptional regulator